MVLQQNSEVKIWGWADEKTLVSVTTSWDGKEYTATANDNRNWGVVITTPVAGGPHSIQINDIKLDNVMSGEVWICSGQSNMQWALSATYNAEAEISSARFPEIRLFYVARQYADEPKKDCYGSWKPCNPETAKSFSAVAYYFGKELHKNLNVPIGLIHTSWGGTPAEAWTRKDVLENDEDLKVYLERFNEKIVKSDPGILPLNQRSPSSLYNAMISPLIPYMIKGAIWYQGEANVREASLYEKLFPAMITNWRQDWGQEFPFYFVQLAPYAYNTPVVGADLRDSQRKTLTLSNTGMAVTMDIGNPTDIHPRNKQDVGKRLALWALAKDYGKKDLEYSGPLYKSIKIEGQKVRVYFDQVDGGLTAKGDGLTHFEVAGADQVFFPAKANIDGETIVAFAEEIDQPVAVRYAFSNIAEPNLFNKAGLPASSFRSDNWPIISIPVRINGHYDSENGDFKIELDSNDPNAKIYYTTDGGEPTMQSQEYKQPLSLNKTVKIKARAFKNGLASLSIAEHSFVKNLATGKNIELANSYSRKYQASGKLALVDGILGSMDYHDGVWQGYEQKDLDVTIDLGAEKEISLIGTRFLQNMNGWIFLPSNVIISLSDDGKVFEDIGLLKHDIALSKPGSILKEFQLNLDKTDTRFIRVQAKNIEICPEWHPGAGGKAWLFCDEIIVE